jgi:diketogulonate reductase-like aldo/keto reductase
MVGRVIAGQRDKVFLVSKVAPSHAGPNDMPAACAASLARLGTDHLDLYLLHWRGGVSDFAALVQSFEALRAKGSIRRWGVSNFGVADLEQLFAARGGDACAANQVRYNLTDRSIERALLPWCERHGLPIMAYSPLGNGNDLLRNPALARVAGRHQSNPAAVALAWTMRSGHAISIPESGNAAHTRENAAALSLRLTPEDLQDLDRAFPAA